VTYATLMVHVAPGHVNTALLRVAGELAERFEANVIGIAACETMQIVYGEAYVSGASVQLDRDDIDRDLKNAEAEFRKALNSRAKSLEWRSVITFGSFSSYFAGEARSADLILANAPVGDLRDSTRSANIGGLIMQAGCPILLVPGAVDTLKLEQVILAWKDTRETRRAARDALPILRKAGHVAVIAIGGEDELALLRSQVGDVLAWLMRHGVSAEPIISLTSGDDAVGLDAIARKRRADLIVAGAYGHSRLGEWALGGMTRNLLLHPKDRCSLVSH
jgi:nucleotide-binding universal stress UspA family protein